MLSYMGKDCKKKMLTTGENRAKRKGTLLRRVDASDASQKLVDHTADREDGE